MTRYWASRPDRENLKFFWQELQQGRLRQGWGYDQSQDLRLVAQRPWDQQSVPQRETYRQRHMLGDEGGWQVGDIVLVPNLPTWGMFALAEIIGPYRFDIPQEQGDYGHIREVSLLTLDGIAFTSPFVNAGIRSTRQVPLRTWNIDHLSDGINRLIDLADDPRLREESTELQRTELTLDEALSAAVAALQGKFTSGLNDRLRAAEWERVIQTAARAHFPTAEVVKTGGPTEEGADVEIEVPNPFGGAPWVVVVQVKDYTGEVGAHVAGQLRRAIESRRVTAEDGKIGRHVVAAVLASTNAGPSVELQSAITALEKETGVPVTVIHGASLMELILRGVFQQGRLEA